MSARLGFVQGTQGTYRTRDSRVYESLALPIWVSHGVRGDFTNYRGLKAVRDRANWKVTVFQTGALPYFELTDAFIRELRAFLAQPQTA